MADKEGKVVIQIDTKAKLDFSKENTVWGNLALSPKFEEVSKTMKELQSGLNENSAYKKFQENLANNSSLTDSLIELNKSSNIISTLTKFRQDIEALSGKHPNIIPFPQTPIAGLNLIESIKDAYNIANLPHLTVAKNLWLDPTNAISKIESKSDIFKTLVPNRNIVKPAFGYNDNIPISIAPRKKPQQPEVKITIIDCRTIEDQYAIILNVVDKELYPEVLNKFQDYDNGNFQLKEPQKKILYRLKVNPFSLNQEIANELGYSVSFVEKTCSQIRKMFLLDDLEKPLDKRQLLIELAKVLPL